MFKEKRATAQDSVVKKMSVQYVGRLSGKHFTVGDDGVSVEDQMKVCALQCAADMGLDSWCFVFEMGSINEEPHMHFYFRSLKSMSTLQRGLKIGFGLPPKVCAL